MGERTAWACLAGFVEGRVAGRAAERSADHERDEWYSHEDLDGPGIWAAVRQVSSRLGGETFRGGFLAGVIDIPDEELWTAHHTLKQRLVEFVRQRVRIQRERLGRAPKASAMFPGC
jgi:hypothetical protein